MTQSTDEQKKLIWWGRGDAAYSRNGVVRAAMQDLGWTIEDFRPSKLSSFGLTKPRGLPQDASVVWVPCFRQRDVAGAARWAKKHGLKLVFDPLISAFDKQVFERKKFGATSARGRWLRRWESGVFGLADSIVADTAAHSRYFQQALGVSADRCHVLPVSADTRMFRPSDLQPLANRPIRILFYGSFIHLQGPQLIVEAARQYPQAQWTLLGDGPLRSACESAAAGLDHVRFEPWVDYAKLPERVAQADILLGVFSDSDKAGRVVPNKVFQAMASGRPVVTRRPLPGAYPWDTEQAGQHATGICFVEPGDPNAIAQVIEGLVQDPQQLCQLGAAAAGTFENFFSPDETRRRLDALLRQYEPA